MPRFLALLCVLMLLAACARATVDAVDPVPAPQPEAPTLPELEPGVWNVFAPGGETVCADGSPYAFFVHPGSVNKVVVDFEGGGACWSDGTCGDRGPYQSSLDASTSARYREVRPSGIYDKDSPANPVGDWYHVFVSYCTGDVHLGNSDEVYSTSQGERTVHHRGQANVEAMLSWLAQEFSAPEAIFVTGCSAGAYGSIVYTPRLAALYPDADLAQLGDCGAGIIPEEFVEKGLLRWNIGEVLPEGVDLTEGVPATFLADAYVSIGRQYPASRLSQYNSAFDRVQIAFYARQQGLSIRDPEVFQEASEAWFTGFLTSMQTIQSELPSFSGYTSTLDDNDTLEDGTAHCILFRPDFYTLTTQGPDGVAFVAWLDRLLSGESAQTVFAPLPEDLDLPIPTS